MPPLRTHGRIHRVEEAWPRSCSLPRTKSAHANRWASAAIGIIAVRDSPDRRLVSQAIANLLIIWRNRLVSPTNNEQIRREMLMQSFRCSMLIVCALSCAQGAFAQLPSWNAEQTAVWQVVQNSWMDDVAENGRWPANYVHDSFVIWSNDSPVPRPKDQYIRTKQFLNAGNNILFYDIAPAAIVIEDDTAVVHYHAIYVTENEKAERERSVDQVVEVLVRENGGWKYLSVYAFSTTPGDD
jgi:hypothetical protein